MKSSFSRYWLLTAAAVLVFASAAFAQSIDVTGVGTNPVVVGNVYVDPYSGSVSGGPTTPVVCDDWSDNTNLNSPWNVTISTINSTGLHGTPLFGASLGPAGQQTLYQELAFLTTMLLQNNGNSNEQAGISFAIWQLTYGLSANVDPTSPYYYLFGGGPTNSAAHGTAAEDAAYNAANQALQAAIASNSLGGAYAFEILTPNPKGPSEGQEFLVQTPEASTILMFGAGVLGLLAMAFFFRRNAFQPAS